MPVSPEQTKLLYFVSMVKFQLTFILDFIHDIMDVKSIEQGKFQPENIDFSLIQLIKDVMEVFKFQAARQQIKIRCKCIRTLNWGMNKSNMIDQNLAGCTMPRFYGDERRLKQVLMNLLSNSMKAVRRKDTILILASYSELERLLYFKVEDSGKGVSARKSQNLFKNNFGTQRTAHVNQEGNGFGLYACKKIVNSFKGDIRMFSEGMGKGASVMFTMAFDATENIDSNTFGESTIME